MEAQIINISGVIDEWGYMTSYVKYYLRQYKDQPVIVRINSYGGSVNEALAIAQAFIDHGNVTVHLLGFNASAATWMCYGAKRVEMADDGFWFCHRSTISMDIWKDMNATDIEVLIQQLQSQKKSQEAIDIMIAKKYMDHAKGNAVNHTIEEIIKLMNEQRWLPAAETHALGFVDAIIKNAKSVTEDSYNYIRNAATKLHLPDLPEREKKDSFLQRVQKFFGVEKEPEQEPETPPQQLESNAGEGEETTRETNLIHTIMEKKFITVNSLLGVEGLQVSDGKVTLTVEQLQTIEDRLENSENQSNAMEDVTAILDGVSANVKAIDGLKNKVLAVLAVVNRMPVAAPAGNQVNFTDPEQERLDAIKQHAVDPINSEAAKYARK